MSVLTLLLLMTLKSSSQTTDSVTCIPNSQLRNAIKDIENCKIIEQELDYTRISVNLLKDRIKIKDSIISIYDFKDSLAEKKFSNYEMSLTNLGRQLSNQKNILSIYKNIVKKEKIIYTFGGLLVGIVLGIVTIIIVK